MEETACLAGYTYDLTGISPISHPGLGGRRPVETTKRLIWLRLYNQEKGILFVVTWPAYFRGLQLHLIYSFLSRRINYKWRHFKQ